MFTPSTALPFIYHNVEVRSKSIDVPNLEIFIEKSPVDPSSVNNGGGGVPSDPLPKFAAQICRTLIFGGLGVYACILLEIFECCCSAVYNAFFCVANWIR